MPTRKQPNRRAKSHPAGRIASAAKGRVASIPKSRGRNKRVVFVARPVVRPIDDDEQDSMESDIESNSSTETCVLCGDRGSKGCHCSQCENFGMIYD